MENIKELAYALSGKAQSLIEDLEDTYETESLGEKLDAIKNGLVAIVNQPIAPHSAKDALDAIQAITSESNVFDIIDAVKAAQSAFIFVNEEMLAEMGQDLAFIGEVMEAEAKADALKEAWSKDKTADWYEA